MEFHTYLLLPFLAAFVFAAASLCFKRAFQEGARLPQVFLANNVLLGLVFLPCFWMGETDFRWGAILRPILTGSLFFLGNLAAFLAIKTGDVSLATPLMGSKVIFVGFLARFLFGWPISGWQWFAVALTTGGVFLLGLTDVHVKGNARRTTFLALGTAFLFALCDVLIQSWAKPFGTWPFLAVLFLTVGVLSILVSPWFGGGRTVLPASAAPWLGMGALGTVMQSALIASSIARFNDAAGVNIVYSTRGLWSILLVWFVGGWFGSQERARGKGKILARVFGASLMTVAVFVTFRKTH